MDFESAMKVIGVISFVAGLSYLLSLWLIDKDIKQSRQSAAAICLVGFMLWIVSVKESSGDIYLDANIPIFNVLFLQHWLMEIVLIFSALLYLVHIFSLLAERGPVRNLQTTQVSIFMLMLAILLTGLLEHAGMPLIIAEQYFLTVLVSYASLLLAAIMVLGFVASMKTRYRKSFLD